MIPTEGINTGKLPYTRIFVANRQNIILKCLLFNPSQKDRRDLLRNLSKTVKSDGFICD